MSLLELKIPPVILVLIFACLMWLVSIATEGHSFIEPYRYTGLLACLSSGGLIALNGVVAFKRARTTVNPTDPYASSVLVVEGIYRFTRNPMYLGFLLILLGYGVFLANLYSLMLIAGFIVYMNRFQILPEERALTRIYGQRYEVYMGQVRRWI